MEQKTTVFTDLQKLRCVERELKMRKKVYPRWVRNGNMAADQADYEIAVMTEVVNEYSAKVQPELLQQELLAQK